MYTTLDQSDQSFFMGGGTFPPPGNQGRSSVALEMGPHGPLACAFFGSTSLGPCSTPGTDQF